MAIKIVYQGPNGAIALDEQQNTTVSSNYTVQPSDYIITATGAGSFAITLPPANPSNGKNILIKCLTTASITVNAQAGEFIDSSPSRVLTNGEVLDIISDGTKWVDTIGTSISGSKIIDGTVTNTKLSPNAVTEAKIASNAITEAKIANNAVTAAKIATGAVGNDEINTSSSPTVNTIYTNNWFRSNGATGWYNQTHGGGIFMEDSSYIKVYNSKAFMPSAGSGNNGIVWPSNPGGGSGDSASIKYYPISGESCRLVLQIANDSDDDIELKTSTASLRVSSGLSFIGQSYAYMRADSGGQFTAIIASPGGNFQSSWPSGWGGGLATWDIICASIQGNIVNTSDARIKENVNSIDSGLDFVLKLKPVSFYWSKDYNTSLKNQQFGFIAQDIEKIMPELVIAGSYDHFNKTEGVRSLNYIGIVPFLTKAIQEQQEQIQSLEERIKKLEELIKS